MLKSYYYLAVPFYEVNSNRIIKCTRAWFTTMNEYLDKLSVEVALAFQNVATRHAL